MSKIKRIVNIFKETHNKKKYIKDKQNRVKQYVNILNKLDKLTEKETNEDVKLSLLCARASLIEVGQILNNKELTDDLSNFETWVKDRQKEIHNMW